MRIKRASEQSKVMAAGGVVASVAASAHGAIVYSNPDDFIISGRTPVSAYLDIQGGIISAGNQSGATDFVITTGASGTDKPYTHISAIAGSSKVLADTNGDAQLVTVGGPVGPAGPGVSFLDTPEMEVPAAGDIYLGFHLGDSTTPLYGWAALSVTVTAPGQNGETSFHQAIIKDWAYESSGGPINAGAVPEASSSAMMAVLAGSAALYRRRGRKTVAA